MGLSAQLVSFALACLFRFVSIFFAAGKLGDNHFAATSRKHGMKEKDKWIRDSSRGIA